MSPGIVFHIAIANAPPVLRPDTGFAVATFQVTLDPANIESPIQVNYSTADGTATAANHDYVPITDGVLTFNPEVTTETIQVQIPAKTQAEADKTFFVNLTGASLVYPSMGEGSTGEGVVIDVSQGVGTILNNHPAGQVQFSTSNYEVNPDQGTAQVTVTRTNGRASDVGVTFTTTAGGTAVPGVDYTPVTKTLTFGLDQTSETVTIPINPQSLSASDLTVPLLLQAPTGGATLGAQSTATLTIHKINPLIVTNTNDSGLGSLRVAIAFADSAKAPTNPTIIFAIKTEGPNPHTITPLTPLPALIRPMTIDGASQPGYANQPVIAINGANLQVTDNGANPADGFDLMAGGTTILGLDIHSFPGSAIVIENQGFNRLLNNRIGTDPTGEVVLPNLLDGVFIVGTSGNIVAGNLISGNGNVGVQVEGPSATQNQILGNKIGTDATGNVAFPNTFDGIFFNLAAANTVSGNLISGNGNVGVQVAGPGSTGNLVQGNVIGTNLAGTTAIPNKFDGVFLNGAPGNAVVGNLISGNGSVGVQLLGAGTTGNSIVSNKIGTDATGLTAIPNKFDGIFLNGAPNNAITSNLISGNGSVGVQVFGVGSTGDVIQSNVIGLNAAGQPLGNAYGVFLNAVPGPGRGNPQMQNTIRGNTIAQVFRTVSSGSTATALTTKTVVGSKHPKGTASQHPASKRVVIRARHLSK